MPRRARRATGKGLAVQRAEQHLAKHYAGVIRELETRPRKPAAEAIAEARHAVFNSGQ